MKGLIRILTVIILIQQLLVTSNVVDPGDVLIIIQLFS
jgi:hypothetical protein